MSTLPALLNQVAEDLNAHQDRISSALPTGIGFEKFRSVVVTAISRKPELLRADRQTLINACVMCAQDGLLPDGRHAALTIYNGSKYKDETGRECRRDEVQYLPMVHGIRKMLRNAGFVNPPVTEVVHRNDVFRHWTDDSGPHLLHEPAAFEDRGEMVGVYAMAKDRDGALYVEVLSARDIAAIRKQSRSPNSLGWSEFPGEMWRGKALKRLSKSLPMGPEVERVLSRDDMVDGECETLDAPPRPALSDFTEPDLPVGEDDDGPYRVLDEYGAVEEYASKKAAVDKLRSMLAGAEESTREALRDLNPDLFDEADHVGAELGLPKTEEEKPDIKALWEKYLSLKDDNTDLEAWITTLGAKSQRYVRRCMEQDGLA